MGDNEINVNHVYIMSAVRTPIGCLNGSLSTLKASTLGGIVIKEAIKRAKINYDEVDEVIMGQAIMAGQGQNPARQAALEAKLPVEVPAYTVNMLCGSGLKTVVLGFQAIRCGDSNIVVCGGQENMSLAPHVTQIRQGIKIGPATLIDSMVHDGLTDAMNNIHMGVTAENIAERYQIARCEQDAFAVKSQKLATTAQINGYFTAEIVPIKLSVRNSVVEYNIDEYIRTDANLASLERLKPYFKEKGTVTAGNSSGVNDGASAVVLMSEREIQRQQLKPLARIVAWAQSGIEPEIMGMGPVKAVQAVLKKANWLIDDVDLYELNEAFAVQTLAILKSLKLDPNKVNINGGAIALGHPIGASGNRILVTLLHALQRTGGKKGVASLCIGGGMGIAIAIECT